MGALGWLQFLDFAGSAVPAVPHARGVLVTLERLRQASTLSDRLRRAASVSERLRRGDATQERLITTEVS